jgi:DEAD/DEAH box helicase domain-containing protein
MSRLLVFDLELCHDPEKTEGGWAAARRGDCGMSLGIVYDSTTERPYVYWEHEVEKLAEHLELGDVLITFNGEQFDIPIVEGLLGRQIKLSRHIDLLREIRTATKTMKGYSLGDLGERCLQRTKEGNGKDALRHYDEGNWPTLMAYCCRDVMLTRDLFNYVLLHGYVLSPEGEQIQIELNAHEIL